MDGWSRQALSSYRAWLRKPMSEKLRCLQNTIVSRDPEIAIFQKRALAKSWGCSNPDEHFPFKYIDKYIQTASLEALFDNIIKKVR